jgi:acetyl-CoA carboxylase carboxyltransferase component
VHCRKSGVGDLEVADDEECIARIKQYLSFFPSHCEERPPVRATDDPVDRMDDELLDVLPESNRQPYDMYDVIRRIVDDGDWLDLKPQWAKTIITCLARMGGRPPPATLVRTSGHGLPNASTRSSPRSLTN